ncbi:glycerophosphodiester phosphodiesterase family protein [Mangrovicoccus sp. HB161399]|uniref:glycerophosphodiester phosphodiesterase family protein n=1 Tax=Mangrovicoccus sp. HB161399 TaxID=2720392 RepID=UPI00352CC37B
MIAHCCASGYLPEHTLGGYELAIEMGANIVEPDVGTTADGQLASCMTAPWRAPPMSTTSSRRATAAMPWEISPWQRSRP